MNNRAREGIATVTSTNIGSMVQMNSKIWLVCNPLLIGEYLVRAENTLKEA